MVNKALFRPGDYGPEGSRRLGLPDYGPEGSRRLGLPDFETFGAMKVVRLSALSTGRLYSPGNIPGAHFC